LENNKADRTLFVTNLPLACSKKNLQKIFGRCGEIQSINFGVLSDAIKDEHQKDSHTGNGSYAHIVFKSEKSLGNALEENFGDIEIETNVKYGLDSIFFSFF